MQSFLNQLSQHIIKNHPDNLGDIAIVLPNRRSHLFLRKEISQQLESSSWAPELFSLEDFVAAHHPLQILDGIDLIFELFQVHREIEGEKAEAFEDFINWASILIQDFNEIDRYLVDASELYSFLSEARAIENWNPATGSLSEFQKNYLAFWSKLKSYYENFRAALLKKNCAYQGLSFRLAAEQAKTSHLAKFDKIYFAGFNALTAAEQKLLNYYIEEQNAECIYDVDDYYFNNPAQEAGRFLRKNKAKIPEQWIGNHFKNRAKKIKLYGAAGNIQQAKLIGQIASKPYEKQTALVLADEGLLLPVLESMPSEIERINVTMGYALSNSSYYDFFEKIISLHQVVDEKEKDYYALSLLSFLNHPVWKNFPKKVVNAIHKLNRQIHDRKLIHVSKSDLIELNEVLESHLFRGPKVSAMELVEELILFCKNYSGHLNKPNPLEKEILHHFFKCFNRIQLFAENLKSDFGTAALLQLFHQILVNETVSFIGEPLSGLQIMGVLESRTLDFDRIIISSLNEGVLPAGKAQNSFIPYDIKRKFKLPSYKEKDAIFAYHFYRLIQRSEEVHLIYNNLEKGLKSAEKSRFILQLEREVQKYNPKIEMEVVRIEHQINSNQTTEIQLENTPLIQSHIEKHLKKGLSASALNGFLNCPLDYYYKYILKLKAKEELDKEMELRVFGNIVHAALEYLYQGHLKQALDKIAFQQIKSDVKKCLDRAFQEEINQVPISGYHKIAYEVASSYVKRVIQMDEKEVEDGNELIIHFLEKEFDHEIHVKHSLGTVRIKGKIDRIDQKNGKYRLIDYKTGGVKYSDLTVRNLEELMEGKKPKSLQLLLYKIAEGNNYPELEAGIVSIKNEIPSFMPLLADEDTINSQELIESCVEKILNPEFIFSHDEKSDYCEFC